MLASEYSISESVNNVWVEREEKELVKKLVSYWLAGKAAYVNFLVADIVNDFDFKDYLVESTGIPRPILRTFVSRMRLEYSLIPRPRWLWLVKKTYEIMRDVEPIFPPNYFADSYFTCPLCGRRISSVRATTHLRRAHADIFEPIYHSVLEALGIEGD